MDAAQRQRQWVLQALDEYQPGLLRFAARLLRDEDAARDAVQHAFLRLCGQTPQRLDGRVGPWLFAVCRNHAMDILRRRGMASDETADDCPDRQPDPAAAAEQADTLGCLGRLVDCLPINQREALSLWAEGFDYRRIAAILNVGEGNVRVIVHRALKTLRQHPAVQRLMKSRDRM